MPNCYIEILAVDTPFEFDVDENERAQYSLNLELTAVFPNDEFILRDLVTICQTAGVGLVLESESPGNGNTFLSSAATLPTSDGPYTEFILQPGLGNLETHDGHKLAQMAAQVIVTGKPAPAAIQRANAIWAALDGVRNLEVA